jgi:hypothetical protein
MANANQVKLSILDVISNSSSMSLGDGLTYIWKYISQIPIFYFYSFLTCYIVIKIIFLMLRLNYARKASRNE